MRTFLALLFILLMFPLFFPGCTPPGAGTDFPCRGNFDCANGYECVEKECVKIEEMDDDVSLSDVVTISDHEGENTGDDFDDTNDMSVVSDTAVSDSKPDEDGETVLDDDADLPTDGDVVPSDDGPAPDIDLPTSCDGVTCGGHGICKIESGSPVCQCYEGYQDKDGDLICLPNCAYSGLDCGPTTHTKCDDSSGIAKCVCDTGYQDYDGDSVCKPTCATAGLNCTGGTCDDSSGTARCICTDPNYQDNDNNGTCLPTCVKAIADGTLSCTTHAHCDDSSGTVTCVCNDGYINPPACSTCAPNFHSDGSGNCVPNQSCTPNYCNGHGTCSDASGMPVCTCDTGYTGTTCNQCASGYQDSDGNGTCLEDCYFSCGQKPAALCPESYGSCQYSGGVASCVCDQGWENPPVVMHSAYSLCVGGTYSILPECSQCKISDPPASYPNGCPATCSDASLTCNNGKCYYDKNTKDIYCKCNSGYTYNPSTTNCE